MPYEWDEAQEPEELCQAWFELRGCRTYGHSDELLPDCAFDWHGKKLASGVAARFGASAWGFTLIRALPSGAALAALASLPP